MEPDRNHRILVEPGPDLDGTEAENVVVVEADAFKETNVIYRALISKGHHNDMLQTAELVHYLPS
ncbi:hypothetical protein CTI12_AA619360 [Artemisia annua]|uniref:Uncharacterized protein n=1 Tax=Artemisia annua TaxID=35608 RepID=A0A2U1KCD4_ARTAN|nr:hypothetical protein CTI12_AA619360 [Artemisia annua]